MVGRLRVFDAKFSRRPCHWWGPGSSDIQPMAAQHGPSSPRNIPGAASSFMGGTIAASTTQNFIWGPADGNQPYYTLNGGQTWNPITLPGVSSWSDSIGHTISGRARSPQTASSRTRSICITPAPECSKQQAAVRHGARCMRVRLRPTTTITRKSCRFRQVRKSVFHRRHSG